MRTWLIVWGLTAAQLQAGPPVLDALYPSGGQAGKEVEVEAIGKFDKEAWPPTVQTNSSFVTMEPGDLGKFKVRISDDAPAEPVLVWIADQEGASPPRIFVPSPDAQVMEAGDNDTLATTKEVISSLPAVFHGRLEKKDDVDLIRLPGLKQGDRLVAQVDAYSLLTGSDPFLHLLDAGGREIAFSSDTHNLDPLLEHVLPEDGDYYLQINALEAKASSNVYFAGGKNRVYRISLGLGNAPLPTFPKPSAQEGESIHVPARVAGTLEHPGETDTFEIALENGMPLLIRVEAATWHSPVDAVLDIYRPGGALLKTLDDSKPSMDPEYSFSPAEEGAFKLSVRDRFQRGGPAFRYHLVLEPRKPDFDATTKTQTLVVKAGESKDLSLDLEREHGHDLPLQIELQGLPDSLSYSVADIPAKSGSIKVKLEAKPDAPAFNGFFQVRVREKGQEEGGTPVEKNVRATFQTKESRGDYLVNEHPELWLTVIPKSEK